MAARLTQYDAVVLFAIERGDPVPVHLLGGQAHVDRSVAQLRKRGLLSSSSSLAITPEGRQALRRFGA